MQVINNILGSELEIGTELTEAQMELLCGGDDAYEDEEDEDEDVSEDVEVFEFSENYESQDEYASYEG